MTDSLEFYSAEQRRELFRERYAIIKALNEADIAAGRTATLEKRLAEIEQLDQHMMQGLYLLAKSPA
jgi:hypothetical protein